MSTNNRALAAVIASAVALSLAWGVSASADNSDRASAGKPALNSSETKAVKKLATKIANRQIKKQAPTLRVASALSADNATNATNATNAQNATNAANAAHASSADMATNAQNAANAAKIGGLDVKKFSVVVPNGAGSATVVSHQGFTITATCAAGVPELTGASTPSGGRMRTARIDGSNAVFSNGSSAVSSGLVLINGGSPIGSVTAEYVSPSGQVVNVWAGYRNDAPGCAFFGNYMVG